MVDRPSFEEGVAEVRERIRDGELDDAERRIAKLRERCTRTEEQGQVFGLSVLCTAYRAADENDAPNQLRQQIRTHRDDPWFLTAAGNELSDAGEYDLAELVYRAVIDHSPQKAAGHFNLGLCLYRDDRKAEAFESLRRAAELDHEREDILIQLAHCAHEIGEFDSATQAYRRYLKHKPDDAHEWIWLGIAESDAGRYDVAVEAYRKSAEIDPDSVSLHYNWLITAGRADRSDDIAAHAQELERLAPDDCRTILGRMYLAEDDGRLWQGWEHAQSAVERAVEQGFEESGDPEVAITAAAAALAYAIRNELEEHVAPVIDRVYEFELFGEESLQCLRELDNRRAAKPLEFAVVVGGDVADVHREEHGPTTFLRAMYVAAESEADARQEALEFEGRCTVGQSIRIEQIEQTGESAAEYLGVLWCGQRAYFADDADD